MTSFVLKISPMLTVATNFCIGSGNLRSRYEHQQQASSRESSPNTLRQTDKPGHTNTFPHIPADCFLMPPRHEGHEEPPLLVCSWWWEWCSLSNDKKPKWYGVAGHEPKAINFISGVVMKLKLNMIINLIPRVEKN